VTWVVGGVCIVYRVHQPLLVLIRNPSEFSCVSNTHWSPNSSFRILVTRSTIQTSTYTNPLVSLSLSLSLSLSCFHPTPPPPLLLHSLEAQEKFTWIHPSTTDLTQFSNGLTWSVSFYSVVSLLFNQTQLHISLFLSKSLLCVFLNFLSVPRSDRLSMEF
jgi:hypothetical protein